MTKKLVFDDGFINVEINGDPDRILRWNPSDVNFTDRFLEFLDWHEREFLPMIQNMNLDKDTFSANYVDNKLEVKGYKVGSITEAGNLLCDKLDKAFGYKVSDVAFLGSSPMTMTGTSFSYLNFLEAIGPLISDSVNNNTKTANEFMSKHKKMKQARRK